MISDRNELIRRIAELSNQGDLNHLVFDLVVAVYENSPAIPLTKQDLAVVNALKPFVGARTVEGS
jgi:hypothetical protein